MQRVLATPESGCVCVRALCGGCIAEQASRHTSCVALVKNGLVGLYGFQSPNESSACWCDWWQSHCLGQCLPLVLGSLLLLLLCMAAKHKAVSVAVKGGPHLLRPSGCTVA